MTKIVKVHAAGGIGNEGVRVDHGAQQAPDENEKDEQQENVQLHVEGEPLTHVHAAVCKPPPRAGGMRLQVVANLFEVLHGVDGKGLLPVVDSQFNEAEGELETAEYKRKEGPELAEDLINHEGMPFEEIFQVEVRLDGTQG